MKGRIRLGLSRVSLEGISRRLMLGAGLSAMFVGFAHAQTVPAPLTPPGPPPPPAIPEIEKPSADASGGQIREIEARPVLRLRGQSTWDEGFAALKTAIGALDAEARKLGLAVSGKPLAHFIDSDDLGFSYEAMLPLGVAPGPGLAFSAGIEAGQSPIGRVAVFPHEGAYDEIDSAYEAITAWLDEKGHVATGKFLEEYLVIPEKSDDPGMKLNIYVFLR